MTKVLVTGGAGFIGSHVVDLLVNKEFDVIVLDNLSTGKKENLNPGAKFIQADIRDTSISNYFMNNRPEYVIHHAAQMNVRTSMKNPIFDADVNILGTLNLLNASLAAGTKRFVHISSSAIYGEPVYLPVNEEHPIKPLCHYGISKHTIEHYVEVYHQTEGLKYTVFRYPNVYGPRQDPNGEAGVIAQLSGKILRDEPITITGYGEQTRDFVYVRDIAMANYLAITKEHPSRVYNLGSNRGTSINQILNMLEKISGKQIYPSYVASILGETKHIHLDPSRAIRDLGWDFCTSLEHGLPETFNYIKASLGK